MLRWSVVSCNCLAVNHSFSVCLLFVLSVLYCVKPLIIVLYFVSSMSPFMPPLLYLFIITLLSASFMQFTSLTSMYEIAVSVRKQTVVRSSIYMPQAAGLLCSYHCV